MARRAHEGLRAFARLAGLVLQLLQVACVHAMPSLWVTWHLDPVVPAGLTCISHPDQQFGGHLGPQYQDPAWLALSRSIMFTVTNRSGAAVLSVCPGQTYVVKVTLPERGHMFITTTAGDLFSPSYAVTSCGNGSRIATTSAATTWTQSLALSCHQVAGRSTVNMRATYAKGQGQTFTTANTTLTVDASCYNATCTGHVPSSPAPSPPPPPAVQGNCTVPPGKPVCPSCIGAALLPSPVPLGQSCRYDQECKVQCEDLVYPNCANAQPLPNPYPSGKCCFYDSQCKPQCEDEGNSKCPKLPTCTVSGCALCSATSSTACEACWAGYILNVVTKKCDCQPGYTCTTATARKCAAGKVNAGGKVSKTRHRACLPCPTGKVANKEQSECVVASSWDHWGYDLTNRRWGYAESAISTTNAAKLRGIWNATLGGDVTATPTIYKGRLYVPDWSGKLWCLDATTGALVWTKDIIDYVYKVDPAPYPPLTPLQPNSTIISRTSPAMSGRVMVVGVMKKGGGWPYLLSIKIADGSLVWGKRVDPHPAAMVTQSPTIYKNAIYIGISSLEELWAVNNTYPCCTFRGNMLMVDLATGNIRWRTYMAPDNGGHVGGFSGNSIWGSSPSVDTLRNQVYISTGNNYEIPENLTSCLTALGPLTTTNYAAAIQCEKIYGQGNYHNSMLALDMTTGKIRWAKQLGGPDAWNGGCNTGSPNPNCAKPGLMDLNSPDYDFGQAPMLVTACKAGFCKQLVVAGQKSGWLWALSPETGDVHWFLPVGPGGTVGGLQWGSAADSSRIYVANNNYLNVTADLSDMKSVVNCPATVNLPPPTSTDGGLAAAVDAYDGTIVWTFANPTTHWSDVGASGSQCRARSQAPMTVANDVLFYPSMDMDGTLFMLDARTGKLLSSFKTGATTGCGPSVVNGKVFIGSGYANFGLGLSGKKLHMLGL